MSVGIGRSLFLSRRTGILLNNGRAFAKSSNCAGPSLSASAMSLSTTSSSSLIGGGGGYRRKDGLSLLGGAGNTNLIQRRGVKTTDTAHPKPIYDDDEKVLRKVLEERNKSEDLPIGMNNPYEKPKKKCILCENGITPDYKNVKLLYQFVSPYTGLKYERNVTGLCRAKQKEVDLAINKAVNFGLMSNYTKPVEFLKDPKLCDPERPVKAHKH